MQGNVIDYRKCILILSKKAENRELSYKEFCMMNAFKEWHYNDKRPPKTQEEVQEVWESIIL